MIELQQPLFLLAALLALYPLRNIIETSGYGRKVSALRFATVLVVAVAASGPTLQTELQRNSVPELTVLEDRTNSMNIVEDVELDLEGVQIERDVIGSGNTTEVASAVVSSIGESQAYLVKSDFRGEGWEKVVQAANERNSTIYSLRHPMEEEAGVKITGPEDTVPGAETEFSVEVTGSGEDVPVELYLDGEQVASGEDSLTYSAVFEQRGNHRLRASIGGSDLYSFNNDYYKTFSVNRKPEVLVLGQEGTLESELDTYFDTTVSGTVPDDLEDYTAVIAKKMFDDDELSEFVAEGNGLVYTGDYGSSSLLPVRPTASNDQNQDSRIVVAIDISSSQSDSIPQTQQLAYSLAEYLPGNVKMGVVAYSEDAYSIMEPATLAYNRDNIKTKISQLETEVLSYHHRGLNGASQMANGEGNIIMMTDGKFSTGAELTPDQVRSLTLQEAEDVDARLLVVGVGDDVNGGFLREVSEDASGDFIQSSDLGSISLRLDAGGGAGSISRAAVWDSNHFITRGLALDSRPALFDSVESKPGARTLVGSTGGEPVLSTWRYGIGRVAAFTADNSDLEALMGSDPALGVRTVNWASGDPARKREDRLEVLDSGKPVKIESSVPRDNFTRKGQKRYVLEITDPERGFSTVQGATYASNTDQEYIEIGYSPEMDSIVNRTGGKVFEPGENRELQEEVVNYSEQQVVKDLHLSPYLVALALIFLLAEVGYRKLKGKR